MKTTLKLFLASLTLTSSLYFADYAQAQQVPTSAEPSRVIQQPEVDRMPSRLQDIISLPEAQTDANKASDKKIFTLQAVVLDGSSVYSPGEVTELFKGMIGQSVSFADLVNMSRQMTVQYREDGYMFSRAILPPQKINGGVVHLQAVEGRVTGVQVVGDFKDENGLIQAYANKIRSEGPANQAQVERYLLLIDDLPGISARSVMKPSDVPGGGDLIIEVKQDPFEGSASIDNRGSRYLGPFRGTLVGAFNSLFGIHDRTTVRGILTSQTKELRYGDITHEEQIGTEGTRLSGRIALTRTNVGGNLKSLDIDGDSELYELNLLHPLIRGRQANLNLLGGFGALDSRTDIGNTPNTEDRVRYAWGGGRYDFTDTLRGVTQIEGRLTQGLDIFNATDDGAGRSRTNGDHTFTRANLNIIRVQELWGNFSAMGSVGGQYSWDPLLVSQEFAIGAGPFGRAYDAGEISGDHGAAGVVELRYGEPLEDNSFIQSYEFYGFYDIGKVWNKSPAAGENANDSLASAGVGVRFNLLNDFSGYVEVDSPLTRSVTSEGDDDSRVFFSLLKRF